MKIKYVLALIIMLILINVAFAAPSNVEPFQKVDCRSPQSTDNVVLQILSRVPDIQDIDVVAIREDKSIIDGYEVYKCTYHFRLIFENSKSKLIEATQNIINFESQEQMNKFMEMLEKHKNEFPTIEAPKREEGQPNYI